MNDIQYDLKLSGAGLQIDQKIDQPTARAIVNLVLGGTSEPPASKPVGPATGPPGVATPTVPPEERSTDDISVGEFIAEVHAKRNPDKIVAMGDYLKRNGKAEFTAEDIKPMFQNAGEPTPANFARDWRWAQNSKWIAPVNGSDKSFYVTNTGSKAVESKFPAGIRKQTTQPVRKRSRKKSNGAD